MSDSPAAIDVLSLQVFANLFSSVAEEMGVTLQRASYSPNIKMRRDYSCAIFDAEAQMLAQAAHMPVHLGAMPMAMDAVRARYDLGPGDVAILNDPYEGGTHLPDISLVSASFDGTGRLLGYVMSRAHHADVGGTSPGSMPLSTEIFQEGVIIPPLLLVKGGETNEALLELILRNVRTPDERRGDFAAQLSAQRVGESGLAALAERYGHESVNVHGVALQAYSETMMRRVIETIPPGEYRFTDFLDGDGQGPGPVRISVAIRRDAHSTDLEIDFTGTDEQRGGSINAVAAVTVSATLYVMRCLHAEETPVNAGSLAPLKIIAPAGTVVAAVAPAPVAGGNVETSQRIVDVLFGALAQALPERVPAASQGTMNNLAFGGYDANRSRSFAYYETMGGGAGARPGADGMSGVHDHMSNTLNTPVEALESELPVRIHSYAIRRGSGGKGRFRGGEGLRRDVQFLEPATVTILSERRERAPYGLQGGDSGAPGENLLRTTEGEERLAGKVSRDISAGDCLSVQTPGGGGFGEPS
jgi:N-methylhydantoinase B/oxoprolinase/acetone carboxylase alpha subunit